MPTPEPTAQAGSIVLAADQPAALARFYGALLGVELQPGLSSTHWRLPWPAGAWLEVYAPSRMRPQPRQQGRLALCLQPLLHTLLLVFCTRHPTEATETEIALRSSQLSHMSRNNAAMAGCRNVVARTR